LRATRPLPESWRCTIFIPIGHLAGILCDCGDSGLTELEPVAVRFAEKMAIDEDIVAWSLDLPFELARFGMVQEAAKLGQTWANFLGDRAAILAEAGWREEVNRQIEEVLHELPDDVWVRIKIGDAHRALGEMEMAERSYRDALKQTVEDYDRDGVLERHTHAGESWTGR